MKKLITLITIIALLSSCTNTGYKKYTLTIDNGSGFTESISHLDCDSFNLITTKKCEFWSDGQKNTICADNVIYPTGN